MKKFFVLLALMFIMNAINGQGIIQKKSVDPSIQNKQSTLNLLNPHSNSKEYIQDMIRNKVWKISGINSQKNLGQSLNYKTNQQEQLLQIGDSIYYWCTDTWTNSMKLYSRSTPLVYDSNHNLTSKLEQMWDGLRWHNGWLYTASYDENSNVTNELYQNWDGSGWWDNEHNIYTYDNKNNLTSYLHQAWNGSNSCVNNEQGIFTYDNSNNIASYTIQNWTGSSWVNYRFHTYTYDSSNNQTSTIIQSWNGSGWVNGWRYSTIYNVNNYPTSLLYSLWFGNWADNQLFTFSYDSEDNLLSEQNQLWHGTYWDNGTLTKYTYDDNRNLLGELTQNWDSKAWVNSEKVNYTYDSKNNQTSSMTQNWKENGWWNYTHHAYAYDRNNFTLSHSSQMWNIDATLSYQDSTHYYFHTVISGIDNLTEPLSELLAYPNPTTSKITIETGTSLTKNSFLIISNTNGQEFIMRQITEPTTVINVSKLPPGIYFGKVLEAKVVQRFKFIKQ